MQKKIDLLEPTLQQLRAVTAEGLLKGTPGCRPADARNKAMKGLNLAQELSKIEGQADDAAKLSTQSQMLTDLIEMMDMVRTPFSLRFSIQKRVQHFTRIVRRDFEGL